MKARRGVPNLNHALSVVASIAVVVMPAAVGQPLETWERQDDETRRAGEAAFTRVCQRCHGEKARGDVGPRLVPFSREYDEVLAIGQMPPIGPRELSDEAVRSWSTSSRSRNDLK
jgi:mono/diheme cytochrome c family protein